MIVKMCHKLSERVFCQNCLPTVSYVFMWSDDRNCDVSADFPTSEAPSIATRNTFITGDSSRLPDSPPFLLNFLGRCEFFLEFTRDGLLDEAPEHWPETSSLVLVLVWMLPFDGMELFRLWTTLRNKNGKFVLFGVNFLWTLSTALSSF